MKDLKYYQKIIQDKRKQTDFRDFLMEIASWYPSSVHRNNGLISKFPDTERIKKVIPYAEFENGRDDLVNDDFDYEFSKDFFENFQQLFSSIDLFNISHYGQNVNCDFGESVLNGKDVYLAFGVISDCESIGYSVSVKDKCYKVFNSIMIQEASENVYLTSGVSNSYNIFYSRYIGNSNNIWFSTNLVGCSECIDCDNLENQKYCIANQQYEKEQYFEKKAEILRDKQSFLEKYRNLKLGGNNIGCENVTGSSLFNCHDVHHSIHSFNTKSGKNLIFCGGVDGIENAYDICGGGSPNAHDIYGVAGVNGDNVYCSTHVIGSHIFYSYYMENCSYCLGCVGLKNKQYCIFNKQYSKDDWYVMVDKIFSKMESDGLLGYYFPGYINPFYFNDTISSMIGNFSQHEVEEKGYLWRTKKVKTDILEGSNVIQIGDLDKYQGYNKNGQWNIDPVILKKIIVDEKGDYYRIVQMEYDFLVKHGLPLPDIHWMDRMKLNFGA